MTKNIDKLINNTLNAFLGSNGLFDELNYVKSFDNRFIDSNYPPCNIERNFEELDNNNKKIISYTLRFALAGYFKEDITIKEYEENGNRYLHIDNLKYFETRQNPDCVDYLKKGISFKKFEIDFLMSEELEISEASMENGMLTIELNVKEIKDASSRIIEIA